MDSTTIVSKINALLHTSARALANWLGDLLPRVTDSWWDDCVLSSLSFAQRDIANQRNFSKLSDFDLAALLRIANRSWYDMRTAAYLPTSERECIRNMMGVRNNWAHCGTDLPDKDTILHDLKIIRAFAQQVGCDQAVCADVDNLINFVEQPDSIIASQGKETRQLPAVQQTVEKPSIRQNSLVYRVSDPQKRGFVIGITDLGETTKYSVFIDNTVHTFYNGQIAPVAEAAGYYWIDVNRFRNLMTAYQINNPSGQNLYSLNSARIDFVPYQFRPALKMIRADEPRILRETCITISSYFETWFYSHVQGQLAHNTENGYRNLIFNHIIPHFKNTVLTGLTEKKIQNFYRKLSDHGMSNRSIWCVHLLLRRILDEACRDGLLTESPAAGINVPHEETQPAMRLRSGQIRRYLEAAKELNVYPILYVGLTSGLRQGELISLPWAAFDMSAKRLCLKKRWINLSNTAAQALTEEHRRHPQSPHMFLDFKTNRPYTPHRLYYLHRRILKQAHLPVISFRDLQTNAKGMRL